MDCIVSIYVVKYFKMIQCFDRGLIMSNWAYKLNDWSRGLYYFNQLCLWRQLSRKEIEDTFGTIMFQISDWLFVPIFCHFVDLCLPLEILHVRKMLRINCLSGNSVYCSRLYFTPNKTINKLNCTKSGVFLSLLGPSETWNWQLVYTLLKIGKFQQKMDQIYFLHRHSQPLYDVTQKRLKMSSLFMVEALNVEIR